MAIKQSGCSEKERHEGCAACRGEEIFAYWCTTCSRSVAEKRCPYCGLKTRKKRGGDQTDGTLAASAR